MCPVAGKRVKKMCSLIMTEEYPVHWLLFCLFSLELNEIDKAALIVATDPGSKNNALCAFGLFS
jgi:hypothetical protein